MQWKKFKDTIPDQFIDLLLLRKTDSDYVLDIGYYVAGEYVKGTTSMIVNKDGYQLRDVEYWIEISWPEDCLELQ